MGLVDKTGDIILLTLACTCTQYVRPGTRWTTRRPPAGSDPEPRRSGIVQGQTAGPRVSSAPGSHGNPDRGRHHQPLASHQPHPWSENQGSAQAGRWRTDGRTTTPHLPVHPFAAVNKISQKETETSDRPVRAVNNILALSLRRRGSGDVLAISDEPAATGRRREISPWIWPSLPSSVVELSPALQIYLDIRPTHMMCCCYGSSTHMGRRDERYFCCSYYRDQTSL